MLFLGLRTGLDSTLILEGMVHPQKPIVGGFRLWRSDDSAKLIKV